MAASGGDWGILGVSLQSPRACATRWPAGRHLHRAGTGARGRDGARVQASAGVLVAPETPARCWRHGRSGGADRVADGDGKGLLPRTPHRAAEPCDHPDIVHDLRTRCRARPRAFWCARWTRGGRRALRPSPCCAATTCPTMARGARRRAGPGPRDRPALADWIAAEGRFPSTMVDRIVPATTPEDIARCRGADRPARRRPVLHEPFRQWVIEDDFVDGAAPIWRGRRGTGGRCHALRAYETADAERHAFRAGLSGLSGRA
jgi:fructuronate reductase